ncbi:hypothetical protein QZH41_002598 [Actinostola sp. cb2023]|nr:hypothetical protein QZH41_002598 [Actinostola sp. cb2023]
MPVGDGYFTLIFQTEHEGTTLRTVLPRCPYDLPSPAINSNMSDDLPSPAINRNMSDGLPSPAINRNRSNDLPSPTINRNMSDGLPSPAINRNRSNDLPSPTINRNMSDGLPSPAINRNRSNDLPSPAINRNMSDGLPSPAINRNRSNDLPSPAINRNMSDGLPFPAINRNRSNDLPSPAINSTKSDGRSARVADGLQRDEALIGAYLNPDIQELIIKTLTLKKYPYMRSTLRLVSTFFKDVADTVPVPRVYLPELTDFANIHQDALEKNSLLKAENEALRCELDEAKSELRKLKFHMQNSRFEIDNYKTNNKDIDFYTGFTSYEMLTTCYSLILKKAKTLNYGGKENREHNEQSPTVGRPRSLTPFQEFVMVLMRLRLGLFERDLAHRFGISEGTVSIIVRTWLKFLRGEFGPLIRLPEKDINKFYSPLAFKELYPDIVIVVDCTEVEMERPSALNNQSACYSSYKSRPTMKALLGITPSGVLAFVSDFFPGSPSDKEITIKSNFLDILTPGDAVMADKGFNVQDELASVGATLVIPHFLKGALSQVMHCTP